MAEDWDMESYNKVYKEGIERHNNYHGIYYQGVQNNLGYGSNFSLDGEDE